MALPRQLLLSVYLVASLCLPQSIVSFVIQQHNKVVQNHVVFTQTTKTQFSLLVPVHRIPSNTRVFVVIGNGEDDDNNRRIGGKDNNNNNNGPSEDYSVEYTGSVDWDAEWKKVMKNKDSISSIDRPGKDFYKSDAEIAAIRAANTATENAARLASNIQVPSIPSWDVLKSDWKFWLGILIFISIATSTISAIGVQSSTLPTNASPDSYYI